MDTTANSLPGGLPSQTELNRQLLDATFEGNQARVSSLISAGANANGVGLFFSDSPLIIASRRNHIAIITILLSVPGILVNQQNRSNETALIHAAKNGHTTAVTTLLATPGILVNERDEQHTNALMYAAMNGHTAIVTALLAVPGILVDLTAQSGRTELMEAIHHNHATTVTALLAAPGINVNIIGDHGHFTALILAAGIGNITCVTALLAAPGIDVNLTTQYGRTAIVEALEEGNHDIVTLLQRHGAVLPAYLRQENRANNINGGQSVHEVSVHLSVSRSAKNLLNQYLYTQEQVINTINELATWLNTNFSNSAALPIEYKPEHLEPAKRCVARLNGCDFVLMSTLPDNDSEKAKYGKLYLSNDGRYIVRDPQGIVHEDTLNGLGIDMSDLVNKFKDFDFKKSVLEIISGRGHTLYSLLDFTDQRSNVTMQQALALVWVGLNNPQAMGGDKPALEAQEIIDRCISFLKHLYEIQRGYNFVGDSANPVDNGLDDKPTCVSGSFNKLIGALSDAGHQGVQIVFVTPALINMQVPFLTKQAFGTLSEEIRTRFAQNWENENSEELQAECFGVLKDLVNTRLHETYDEFHTEVPNLDQVIIVAAANTQYTDLDAVMNQEREAIQKKEQAERERQAAAVAAPMPAVRQQRAAVVFSCDTRGVKRSRAAEAVNAPEPEEAAGFAPVGRYPKRSTRTFTGSYKV